MPVSPHLRPARRSQLSPMLTWRCCSGRVEFPCRSTTGPKASGPSSYATTATATRLSTSSGGRVSQVADLPPEDRLQLLEAAAYFSPLIELGVTEEEMLPLPGPMAINERDRNGLAFGVGLPSRRPQCALSMRVRGQVQALLRALAAPAVSLLGVRKSVCAAGSCAGC